ERRSDGVQLGRLPLEVRALCGGPGMLPLPPLGPLNTQLPDCLLVGEHLVDLASDGVVEGDHGHAAAVGADAAPVAARAVVAPHAAPAPSPPVTERAPPDPPPGAAAEQGAGDQARPRPAPGCAR